jgi:hypothetical protein
VDALRGQRVERLVHRRAGRAEVDHAQRVFFGAGAQHRLRHQRWRVSNFFSSRCML